MTSACPGEHASMRMDKSGRRPIIKGRLWNPTSQWFESTVVFSVWMVTLDTSVLAPHRGLSDLVTLYRWLPIFLGAKEDLECGVFTPNTGLNPPSQDYFENIGGLQRSRSLQWGPWVAASQIYREYGVDWTTHTGLCLVQIPPNSTSNLDRMRSGMCTGRITALGTNLRAAYA